MKKQCYAVYCDGHFIRFVEAPSENEARAKVKHETFGLDLTGVHLSRIERRTLDSPRRFSHLQ